jgi:hypothetical protein
MLLKNRQFWLALLLLLIIAVISVGNYQRWWDWRFPVGPFASTHWLVWLGAGYIAVFTPLYAYLRRHTSGSLKNLLTIHVFGNLVAFLFIAIHYTQQAGRPPEFGAVHSTGLILFIIVTIMVVTGFLQRFGIIRSLIRSWRFIHVSLSLSFYIVLIVHVLQFFQIV